MDNGEWLVSIVKQSNNVLLARLDLYSPFRVTLDNLNLIELVERDTELEETIKQEVKDKVKYKTITVVPYQGSYNGTWLNKKNTSEPSQPNLLPSGEVIIPNAKDSSGFFENLADADWEDAYGWEYIERSRLNGRWSE